MVQLVHCLPVQMSQWKWWRKRYNLIYVLKLQIA
jgi:hypothetical protein